MSNISLSDKVGQSFNDIYPRRPVWALASMGVTSTLTSPVYSTYDDKNPYTSISTEFAGSPKSRARNYTDEIAQTASFYGNASAQSATTTHTPAGGHYGITSNFQTGCLANFDTFDNGNYGFYNPATYGATDLALRAGNVVGESNWRQCYDLVLTESGNLYKDVVGGSYNFLIYGGRPKIGLTAELGPAFSSAGQWGYGMISHNRNTKRLLIVQPVSGVDGVSLTFRLHFFDLQNKIDKDTTLAQLKSWLVAATQVGANRYRFVNVTFSNACCGYTGLANTDMVFSKFVLCDNDEVWMFKSADVTLTSTAKSNALFRVNRSGGGNWLTDTYTATFVLVFAATTCYGGQTSPIYAPKHTNSDDNSVMAFYQQYYYYVCGYNIAYVSTKDAGATSYNYTQHTSTTAGYTIAPMGGPNFVLCASGENSDGPGAKMAFAFNETLGGVNQPLTFTGGMWPTYASSTCYGGNLILKVQPTTEWK